LEKYYYTIAIVLFALLGVLPAIISFDVFRVLGGICMGGFFLLFVFIGALMFWPSARLDIERLKRIAQCDTLKEMEAFLPNY